MKPSTDQTTNLPYPGDHKSQSTDTNKLRAAVLGANDGTVSVASIIVGVAGASNSAGQIITAGIAGLVAGAISMGLGEYVSVSSQRDTERVLLQHEKYLLENYPVEEQAELASIYQAKGLSPDTAKLVAAELTKNDALAAHYDAELGIKPDELTNPWHAAIASSLAFTAGGVIPLLAAVIGQSHWRILITVAAVIVTLSLTGVISARVSGASRGHTTRRVVIGGAVAMAVTYIIGRVIGTTFLG